MTTVPHITIALCSYQNDFFYFRHRHFVYAEKNEVNSFYRESSNCFFISFDLNRKKNFTERAKLFRWIFYYDCLHAAFLFHKSTIHHVHCELVCIAEFSFFLKSHAGSFDLKFEYGIVRWWFFVWRQRRNGNGGGKRHEMNVAGAWIVGTGKFCSSLRFFTFISTVRVFLTTFHRTMWLIFN